MRSSRERIFYDQTYLQILLSSGLMCKFWLFYASVVETLLNMMGGQKEGNSLSHLETVETTAHL